MNDTSVPGVVTRATAQLAGDEGPGSAPLSAWRAFLDKERARVQRLHENGGDGLVVARALSDVYDALLQQLFARALARFQAEHGDLPAPLALVALGGYGRQETCPHSDIDIMFLYPNRLRPRSLQPLQEVFTNVILYMLWDLNLKVGHSTRSVRETMVEGKSDVQSKHSMVEARHVAGDEALFRNWQKTYRRFVRRLPIQPYIDARLADQEERQERYGNTVFLQEPDIKNGVGGLRDYQNIVWLARIKLGVERVDELVRHHLLTAEEERSFTRAYTYLLRVRNDLHFSAARASDLLDLEAQPRIAENLGYSDADIFVRVERFMKDYYTHAQTIFQTARLLERRLALNPEARVSFREVLTARRETQVREFDGFTLLRGEIHPHSEYVFQDDPIRLLRIFRHMQQYGGDLSLDLIVLIRQSLGLITSDFVRSTAANKAFRSLLQSPGEVYAPLQKMHELGVLARFLPEWSRLVCLVQHEYYHRYTADVHVLSTVRQLDRIFAREDEETYPYHRAIHETSLPTLLYTMLLLHDIGKGFGIEGHAERGAEMAPAILERLGVIPELREKIVFIIRNHLEMARFWQRYDVDDPDTIAQFSALVEDEEKLHYLFVLTYCDARGTTENLWNSYKDMLHRELYQQTRRFFADGGTPQAARRQMISLEQIQEHAPELAPEEVEAHFNLLPDRYFLNNTLDEVLLHLDMVNRLLQHIAEADSLHSLEPVVEWQDDLEMSMTVVNIVTWDRAGLFYRLAGAFSVANLSIISSRAITRSDHITIDTFYVCEPGGGAVQNKKARQAFEEALEKTLLHGEDLLPNIDARAQKQARSNKFKSADRLQAPAPISVDVYHEVSLKRTIIEIQAPDQIGILYRIAKTISDHGYDITFARISTERGMVVDTFHITESEGARPQGGSGGGSGNLLALRRELTRIISTDLPTAVGQ